jgi:N-acetylglucosaminyldiphosphoundecaprenol N-acetyl-beta-D-mannosaminyltransferase
MSVTLNKYTIFDSSLETILLKKERVVINTINAHSYIVANKDPEFRTALLRSNVLLPDGEGIVMMAKTLKGKKITKIAGADIHEYLLNLAQNQHLKCFYLGSSPETLERIKNKLIKQYHNIKFDFFSPPFKPYFTEADNKSMISQINAFKPDILFVGMTAPKQEKWVFQNKNRINTKVICSIGAVFDFIAETKKRAPQWVIQIKMEWLYRSFTAWRLTKRYLYSTPLFLIEVYKLKFFSKRG